MRQAAAAAAAACACCCAVDAAVHRRRHAPLMPGRAQNGVRMHYIDLLAFLCVPFDVRRLDFVKGFHGSHVKDYLEASCPEFVVGERPPTCVCAKSRMSVALSAYLPTHLPTVSMHPSAATGEYWDSLAYGFDGTPAHNQDAHRQRTVNWIEAAGGLATAFGRCREARRGSVAVQVHSSCFVRRPRTPTIAAPPLLTLPA